MAFSMPAGVSYTRCGGLPRRGSRVVPFSTMAPAARLERPSIRVYSSPNPTQPESSTIGEAKSRPQNLSRSELGSASEAAGRLAAPAAGPGVKVALARIIAHAPTRTCLQVHVPHSAVPARDPAQHRQRHPPRRQLRGDAPPREAARLRADEKGRAPRGPRLRGARAGAPACEPP